jgi:N-acyl-D-aspartate/D-glutamate deacylase
MLDFLLKGGSVVDGTGLPPYQADVGIRASKIVQVGKIEESAARTVDCEGLVVCPGFIDIHTHYDPHVMWDPFLSPSSLNGVTTIIGGNCGFSIAPIDEDAASYLIPMLARVEGMPLASLQTALDLNWSSFGSWLDRLEGSLAINAGFLVGHSAIRRLVMKEDAVGEQASPRQLAVMVELVHASLAAGACGFSSTRAGTHTDHQGDPVPSRHASDEELLTLCQAVRDHPGTVLEFIPSSERFFGPEIGELVGRMSEAAQRSLNWNVLTVRPGPDEAAARSSRLAISDRAAELGGRVYALSLPEPTKLRLTFSSGFLYDTLPGWDYLFRLPLTERCNELSDPQTRRRLLEGARRAPYNVWSDWDECTISDVGTPALQGVVGTRLRDLAPTYGRDAFDALLSIVTADSLATGIESPSSGDDDESWNERRRLWTDHRVVIGGSDAGAHLDLMSTFSCYVRFLSEAVRHRELLSLPDAIHLITEVPARLYGLSARGQVQEGFQADLLVLNPEEIGPGPVSVRSDLPSGGWRLYSVANGIEHTFVNGIPIAENGRFNGSLPGRVIHSGRDTVTVGFSELP